jgi:hypothetical protein
VRPKPLWKLTKETHVRRYSLLILMVLSMTFFILEGKPFSLLIRWMFFIQITGIWMNPPPREVI